MPGDLLIKLNDDQIYYVDSKNLLPLKKTDNIKQLHDEMGKHTGKAIGMRCCVLINPVADGSNDSPDGSPGYLAACIREAAGS